MLFISPKFLSRKFSCLFSFELHIPIKLCHLFFLYTCIGMPKKMMCGDIGIIYRIAFTQWEIDDKDD